jgi:large subunit ribosomal protein L19
MESVVAQVEAKYKKKAVAAVKSGDTVRVSQKVKEGSKERVQVFEGLVIRVKSANRITATIVVRRIASGVGVEKTFLLHSPNVLKVEIVKRSKVRKNYLSYMRQRSGKGARLAGIDFDKEGVNVANDEEASEEEAKIKEEQAENYEADTAERVKEEAEEDKKAQAALAAHDVAKDGQPEAETKTKDG